MIGPSPPPAGGDQLQKMVGYAGGAPSSSSKIQEETEVESSSSLKNPDVESGAAALLEVSALPQPPSQEAIAGFSENRGDATPKETTPADVANTKILTSTTGVVGSHVSPAPTQVSGSPILQGADLGSVGAHGVEDSSEADGGIHGEPHTPPSLENSSESKAQSLGAWNKPLNLKGITPNSSSQQSNKNKYQNSPDVWPSLIEGINASNKRDCRDINTANLISSKPPKIAEKDFSDNKKTRFPWAAKMNPTTRNLYRATEPTYLDDGTPQVTIPSHVFQDGLENQKEYIIGQFYRCSAPSGGLTHAVVNRIWGRKCRIFTKRLSETTFLFHIPDETTRSWVLQRSLWHVDDCLMFVAQWNTTTTLDLPEISTVPVWVTLRNIPTSLYSIKALSWIASGVGEPMLSYKPRLDPTEIGKAKVMVEIELSKPFPQKVSATDKKGNSSLIDVEYTWIPTKCTGCGHLGHKLSRCLQKRDPQLNNAGHAVPETSKHIIPEKDTTDVTMQPNPSTSAENSAPEENATMPITKSTAITLPTTYLPTETSPGHEKSPLAPLMASFSHPQQPQQKEVSILDTTKDDSHQNLANKTGTSGDDTQEATKVIMYSSSEDTYDDLQQVEERLLRKSTRGIKPTLKAQEMQRPTIKGSRGRRGRGKTRGRSHR